MTDRQKESSDDKQSWVKSFYNLLSIAPIVKGKNKITMVIAF